MAATHISNNDDVIDSRDVIERIEELQAESDLDEADRDELEALVNLAEEASGYAPDWEYGEALIRGTYFTQYAEQLADDRGLTNTDNAA